jgi:hypothetical protein
MAVLVPVLGVFFGGILIGRKNVLHGVLAIVLSLVMIGFWSGFWPAFNASYHASRGY